MEQRYIGTPLPRIQPHGSVTEGFVCPHCGLQVKVPVSHKKTERPESEANPYLAYKGVMDLCLPRETPDSASEPISERRSAAKSGETSERAVRVFVELDRCQE